MAERLRLIRDRVAQGIDPLRDVESVVLPPPQMADALKHGEIDGFCAGEPWHTVVKADGTGRMKIASGTIWPKHPEKALACRRDFAARAARRHFHANRHQLPFIH